MTYTTTTGTHKDVAEAMSRIQDTLVNDGPFDDNDVDIWVNQNGHVHVDFDIEFDEFPVRQDIGSAQEARIHLDNAYAALIGTADEELIKDFENWRAEHADDLDI